MSRVTAVWLHLPARSSEASMVTFSSRPITYLDPHALSVLSRSTPASTTSCRTRSLTISWAVVRSPNVGELVDPREDRSDRLSTRVQQRDNEASDERTS